MSGLPRIEVVMKDMHTHPSCPHGPTLLFRRISGTTHKDFFACSACRDRKDCNFFMWADEKVTENKLNVWNLEKEKLLQNVNQQQLSEKLEEIKRLSTECRGYCHTCSILITSSEFPTHISHNRTVNISDYQLQHPSELLEPLGNAKKEAQYLFSKQTSQVMLSALLNYGVSNILCVGTPRLHELVQSDYSDRLESLLLDIDSRYLSFYSKEKFCWFNCFNNYHFFGKQSVSVLRKFLRRDDVVLVMDPPFGGRVEPLAFTVNEISALYSKVIANSDTPLPVMWIFPYFMEPQILESCPNYKMLDYKVDYDNHPLFTQGSKGRKHGSPVRIFTNIEPKLIKLPKEEGYRYCSICERWVSNENRHCKICNSCTSKDGRTYIHCSNCERCVKPSWEHCSTCKRCCLPTHKCGEFSPSAKCFMCGVEGHKKSDCPLKDESFKIDNVQKRIKKRKKKHQSDAQQHTKKMKIM